MRTSSEKQSPNLKLARAVYVFYKKSAVAYLKERQAGVATILPLSDVRPWPVDEIPCRIGGTARPVIDVATQD